MRTISVLYIDENGNQVEQISGNESTEPKARSFAFSLTRKGATNIVIRCTHPDPAKPYIIHTDWTEAISDGTDEQNELQKLRDQMAAILLSVRSANDLLPIAFAHHDDADHFGWHDRDAEAWRIIADIACEIDDALAEGKHA